MQKSLFLYFSYSRLGIIHKYVLSLHQNLMVSEKSAQNYNKKLI